MESWLRLVLAPELGPVLGHRLLETFGRPEAIFAAASRQLLAVSGLGPHRLARLMDASVRAQAAEEWERAREGGVRLLTPFDEEYPPLLKRLEYHPLLLWVRGRIDPLDRLAVAMVGPRSPSLYAKLMTGLIAPGLAAHGLTLVSGLAHGVDAAAHRLALDARGRTLAVLGQGLGTRCYPQANAELALRIVQEDRGALISIFPMATEPSPGQFPMRNELIAALALGTLVVEASPASGALITARHALAAGRVVLACPGDATRQAAQGSNRLLAEGAVLVQTAEDVLAALAQELRQERVELGPWLDEGGALAGEAKDPKQAQARDEENPPGRPADPLTATIMVLLREEPQPLDVLIERSLTGGHTTADIMERLLHLELDGFLRQMPGHVYALTRKIHDS